MNHHRYNKENHAQTNSAPSLFNSSACKRIRSKNHKYKDFDTEYTDHNHSDSEDEYIPCSTAASLSSSKRTKRRRKGSSSRSNSSGGGGEQSKGLRHFSSKVSKIVQQRGTTTYNEVADDLIREKKQESKSSVGKGRKENEKNIRRRVYDALNVLMAINVISKEGKQIHWVGLPATLDQLYPAITSSNACASFSRQQAQEKKLIRSLEEQKDSLSSSLIEKREKLKELIEKYICYKNLDKHNKNQERKQQDQEHIDGDVGECAEGHEEKKREKIKLPFVTVRLPREGDLNIMYSRDKSEVIIDSSRRFVDISDDVEVLKGLGLEKCTVEELRNILSEEKMVEYCIKTNLLDNLTDSVNDDDRQDEEEDKTMVSVNLQEEQDSHLHGVAPQNLTMSSLAVSHSTDEENNDTVDSNNTCNTLFYRENDLTLAAMNDSSLASSHTDDHHNIDGLVNLSENSLPALNMISTQFLEGEGSDDHGYFDHFPDGDQHNIFSSSLSSYSTSQRENHNDVVLDESTSLYDSFAFSFDDCLDNQIWSNNR